MDLSAFMSISVGFAVPSVFASLMVIMTLLTSRKLRNKFFARLIAFISFSDFLGNLPFAFPYRPSNGSILCKISSFLSIFPYPASWMWTVFLGYCIYMIGLGKTINVSMASIHLLCWGYPLIVALVILLFSNYSYTDDHYKYYGQTCGVQPNENSLIYIEITIFGNLILCLSILIYFWLKLWNLKRTGSVVSLTSISYPLAYATLGKYPLLLMIFWIPNVVVNFLFLADPSNYTVTILHDACSQWVILHGLCTAIIFFYYSEEAQKHWIKCFGMICIRRDFQSRHEDDSLILPISSPRETFIELRSTVTFSLSKKTVIDSNILSEL